MAIWSNLAGTVLGYFRLGLTGPRLKNNAGVLAVRNAGDTADASVSMLNGTVAGTLGVAGATTVTTLAASGDITAAGTTGGNFVGRKTTAPATDTSLYSLAVYALDTSVDALAGTINFKAAETWSPTAHGSYIQFRTKPVGTDTLTENMRITGSGVTIPGTLGVTGAASVTTLAASGVITLGSTIRLKGYTVATLPAAGQGDKAFVTDALAPAYLVTVVGGGTVVTEVFYNGTNWVCT